MMRMIARLGLLGAGALAMYYLDPQMGAHRRALLLDLLGGDGRRPAASGAGFRGRVPQRAYHRIALADPGADAQLRTEIQGRLGRLVSHPRAIDVRVQNGEVRLTGDVLAKERDGLLLQVREMEGVQKLVNAMTAHDSPSGIASLEASEEAATP